MPFLLCRQNIIYVNYLLAAEGLVKLIICQRIKKTKSQPRQKFGGKAKLPVIPNERKRTESQT